MSAPNDQTSSEATTTEQIKMDYKAKLDQAAEKIKNAEHNESQSNETLLDKVAQYVPAVGKMLGKEEKNEEPVEPSKPAGPPHRPIHDTQIEEFVRDQHRSQNNNGVE